MRKLITLLWTVTILFSQCSTSEYEKMRDNPHIPSFPKDVEEYGKAVAKEVRGFTIDAYKNANIGFMANRKELESAINLSIKKLNTNNISRSSSESSNYFFSPEHLNALIQVVKTLSKKQLDVLEAISKAKQESNSSEEFLDKLVEINKFVQDNVPEIEQRRLSMIISTLYYSLQEINQLTEEGYLPGEYSQYDQVNILTRSGEAGEITEPTKGDIGTWCKQAIGTVWLVAIAEPTPFGELIATGATIVLATGVILYQYRVVCYSRPLTPDECLKLYLKCMEKPGMFEGGPCYDRYVYCKAQGVWDDNIPY